MPVHMAYSDSSKRFSIGLYGLTDSLSEHLVRISARLDGHALSLASPEALATALAAPLVDALIVDFDEAARIAAHIETAGQHNIPVLVFVSNLSDTEAALALGAADVFSYALNPELLRHRLEKNLIAYRAQRQLTTYRGRFETLYDHAPVMMHVLSYEGIILRVNQQWSETLGYPLERIVGTEYRALLAEQYHEAFPAILRQFFAEGAVRDLPTSLRAADGTFYHFMLSASVFVDASGEAVAITMLRDVTDIQRSEARLRESALMVRSLMDASSDAILLIEPQTERLLQVNEPAARLLGYSTHELLALTARDLAAAGNLLIPFVSLPDDRTTLLEDVILRRRDGSFVPVESHSRILEYEGRSAVLTTLRDITLRQMMLDKEKTTRILAETLRDSAAQFARAATVNDVLDTAIRMVLRVMPAPVAHVSRVEADRVVMVRWIGYDRFGFQDESLASMRIALHEASHILTMLETRQPLYLPDVERIGWPDTEVPTSTWVKSCMAAPILLRGSVYGFLNVDSPEVNAFRAQHQEALEVLAGQVSIALERATLLEELQTAKSSLEQTVTERTEALIQANRSLRRYIEELRTTQQTLQYERSLLYKIIDSIADMIYVKDREGKYILVNRASVIAMGGSTQGDTLGRSLPEGYDATAAQLHEEVDRRIMETGQPVLNLETTVRYADGTLHRQLLSKQPLYDAQGEIIGIVGINRDITELKLIEQHLREEREQLAQVLRSARCLLWTATLRQADGAFAWSLTVVNEDAAQDLLPLALDGSTYSEQWPRSILPEDAQRREYALRAHLQVDRRSFTHEMRCRTRDGSLMWLAEDVMIRAGDEGEWCLVGICTDITQRKAAEEALRSAYDDLEVRIQERIAEVTQINETLREEVAVRQRAEDAERRQRLLAEALTQSLAALNSSFDRDALFDYLLDAIDQIIPHCAASIMLVDADRLTGRVVRLRGYGALERLHSVEVDISQMPNKMQILRQGTYFIISDSHTYPRWLDLPSTTWVRSSLSVPITMDEGVIGFLNVESDQPNSFTVQHVEWLTAFANQAALAMRNARLVDQIRDYAADRERLAQARTAQLRAVLGSIRDGLIYHNEAQEAQYLNRALVDILGYSSEDWMSGRVGLRDLLHGAAEDSERSLERIARQLDARDYAQEELLVRRRDGHVFPALLTRLIVRDDNSAPLGTLTLLRDISAEKTLQEQRERFIANASHELRTPIANLKTRLYLMSRRPDSILENLEIITKVTNWMQRLVDDMFDLSRFQRGLLELQREEVDLRSLLRDAMIFQQPEAERKDILMVINAPTEPVRADIDPYRMLQVFSNLVSNAIHYTPTNGQVVVEIGYTRADEAASELRISVSDSGSGIAPDHLAHLFKPFYRGTTDNRGAGLGLAIAQEIVHLHGGRITVESTLGVGSRFTVLLPLLPARDPS